MNLLKLSIISTIIIIASFYNSLNAQKVCAAEILKINYFPIEHRLRIEVYVCRQHTSKDSLIFDWGDGYIDTIPRFASGMADSDHVIDFYTSTHFYDTTINEYVLLSILNEEVEEGYANVDYSANTTFLLSDSILIYNEASIPANIAVNDGPIAPWGGVLGIQNYGYPSSEIWLMMMDDPVFGAGDSLIYNISPFPVEGYFHPAPENEFYMDGGLMIWDTPMVAGKYAVACKIREMTRATNPIYEEDRVLFSTITRAFTIIVDSSDIVSTIGITDEIAILSIYPNPTQNHLQIEYGGLIGKLQLQINNPQGQQVYKQTLAGTTRLKSQQIDVSHWPSGIYFVAIESENGRLVRKLVVE